MAESVASAAEASGEGFLSPYPPSWMDRLIVWVERLPGPAWLYYLGATVIYSLAYLLVRWWMSGHILMFSQTFLLVIASSFYYLFAIQYLDTVARHAMDRFRPAIKEHAHWAAELEYRLTTMPARAVWLTTLAGLLTGILLTTGIALHLLVYPGPPLFNSTPESILEVAITLWLCVIYITYVYHTVRQMQTVSIIYGKLTKVDLFNQTPLHAFARLAAYTAIALIIPQYFWFTAGLQGGALNVSIGFLVIAMVLGVLIFLWPLQGIHNRLTAKKHQIQAETGRRLEKCLQLFAQALDKEDMGAMAAIGTAIANVERERQIVDAIPTWPWQPGLLRGAVTAFFLPLIVWMATRFLQWLFGL